jgi:MFS family permease/peptidoglycan hydrolase-like protein with peptidoglycan-binding domain
MSIAAETIRTTIPARLDRLPWSRWHWLIVFSLGTVWVLDGLEVTIKGAVGASLKDSIGFSTVEVAGSASIYLFGAISGALVWGYLTDRFGRQLMFILTISTYMVGVLGTTLAGLIHVGISAYVWFAIFRFITGFGIGGEYAAVNSAIDELMPARVRGWVALTINGSYWIGTVVGASLGFVFLQTLPSDLGWRLAFGIGGFLALGILLLRLFVPESPRWLITHGREEEAERSIEEIERRVREDDGVDELSEPSDDEALELRERESIGFITLARTVFGLYPRRALSGFSILVTQAFLYNAIFFTYGLMLTTFFGVSSTYVPLFLIPFAIGNFLGPLLLGPLFESLGRKVMIPATFWIAGALTILTGFLFWEQTLGNQYWMTVAWVVIFFFASAGASSGYLTVSETFPLEIRALAIAFFYAIGTAAGGIAGPYLYGALIATEARVNMFYGYLIGGGLMILGGVIHRIFGVEAAQKSLEEVALPLSAEEATGNGRIALEGPQGIDLADPASIEQFQREHDLEPDGMIGPRTMGAIATAADPSEGYDAAVLGFDVTDADSVVAFQERAGITADGVIGPETRGALAAAHLLLGVDAGDAASARSFQEEFGLAADGVIGPETQAAMRAVTAERGLDDRLDVDPTDARSVRPFQELLELEERDGSIGPATRGALATLRAERERTLGTDVTDPDQLRALQRALGVPESGQVDEETRASLRVDVARRAADANGRNAEDAARPLLDPTVEASIRRFQRENDLAEDGIVGLETRRALREQRYRTLGVDAGDPESIRAFQRDHGLTVDGAIGPEVQGAMDAVRSQLPEPAEVEEAERDGEGGDRERPEGLHADEPFALDPSDPHAVCAFQNEHGLVADGIVGPLTQAAIRAVQAERERTGRLGEAWAGHRRRERITRPYQRRQIWSGFHYPPLYPAVDSDIGDEIDRIVRSLDRDGPARARELSHRIHADRWGPGRFRRATQVALDEGRVRRRGSVLHPA